LPALRKDALLQIQGVHGVEDEVNEVIGGHPIAEVGGEPQRGVAVKGNEARREVLQTRTPRRRSIRLKPIAGPKSVSEKCVVASCSSSSFVLRPQFGGGFRGRGRGTRTRTRRAPNFQTRSKPDPGSYMGTTGGSPIVFGMTWAMGAELGIPAWWIGRRRGVGSAVPAPAAPLGKASPWPVTPSTFPAELV
jgi:hypothetical protein